MQAQVITYESTAHKLSWPEAVEALRAGHMKPKAEIGDAFLGPGDATLLSRSAYIEGLGYGVKSVTVFDRNPQHGLPTVQGAMLMFEPQHGRLAAVIDSRLITEFKTAADSVLGARLLARPGSKTLLIVGAGTVAASLMRAYGAAFPGLERILIWARRPEQAESLARDCKSGNIEVSAVADLPRAAATADIIATATMARDPVLKGAWVRPGTHIDLIGAYKADMREADDALISAGPLFVDARQTTIGHIGELTIPIANGVITEDAVMGDFYDLIAGAGHGRSSDRDITLFKNGGGAHLDLMMAGYIAARAGV